MPPSCGSSNGRLSDGNHIHHQVSKMDTLAGVAIKYGVEVSDLKRLNGLASDLQMFALKTLRIPLPGRHPPSSSSADHSGENAAENAMKVPRTLGFLDSFDASKLRSQSRNVADILQSRNGASEGMELSVFKAEISDYLTEGLLQTPPEKCDPSPGDGGDEGGERASEKFVRRRQKPESDARNATPEKLFKDDANGSTSDFSPITGQRLSMRGKSGSKSSMNGESEPQWLKPIPVGLGDSFIADGLCSVRKSSSTSSLLDQESSSSSSWAAPKWNLKQDLQSLSTVAINIPIFDGLPKPISGRKSKAALD